jgi:tetratricopeptide (TPR) repeat protein
LNNYFRPQTVIIYSIFVFIIAAITYSTVNNRTSSAIFETAEQPLSVSPTQATTPAAVAQKKPQPATPAPTPSPIVLAAIPDRFDLTLPLHNFQTFNNCGPATLAMTLSYFDIRKTQKEIGDELRPYQNAVGDNDDKSVSLEELAAKAEELGFVTYHRPSGDIELLQQLTASNVPVITRTWTKVNEDIGHYRVVTGYDKTAQTIIQDDSLKGKDISIPAADFLIMWEKFNYEFLVVVPPEKAAAVEAVLGALTNEQTAWQTALQHAQEMLQKNPNDTWARYNLSISYYHLGDYEQAVSNFEAVETKLSPKTLWYQQEPLLAYYELREYPEVLTRIDSILSRGNRAYSELYYLRGKIFQEQGNAVGAREQFELALRYNKNYWPAQEALDRL